MSSGNSTAGGDAPSENRMARETRERESPGGANGAGVRLVVVAAGTGLAGADERICDVSSVLRLVVQWVGV